MKLFLKMVTLFLFHWRTVAGTPVCQSNGFCQETQHQCKPDSLQLCFPDAELIFDQSVYPSYEPLGPHERTEVISSSQQACTGTGSLSNISLQNIHIKYISINPTYLSVCITWTLTDGSGHYGGLEIRILNKYNAIDYRYCVKNTYETKVCINRLRYDTLSSYKAVDVLPYPLALDDNEVRVKKSAVTQNNIEGCVDVIHNGTVCGIKQYKRPQNITVISTLCEDETKKLDIIWKHPELSDDEIVPSKYYIYLFNQRREILDIFVVDKDLKVCILNLSGQHSYYVGIQAYRMCAGLGNYGTTGNHKLGCGKLMIVEENHVTHPNDCLLKNKTTAFTEFYGVSSVKIIVNGKGLDLHTVILIVTLCSLSLIICVAAFAIILIYALLKYCGNTMSSFVCPQKTQQKVFVFFSPSTSEASLEYIQKHIICNLLEYFDIVTPNDLTSGNISVWLEESMNSVDSVLIVGNKDFRYDWEQEERSPLLNSLELLVSAAASQNTIGKFCFISVADSTSDVSIPNNSYLKLMPVFLMGQKKFEIDKLYQFVTKSRGIEFSNDF